MLKKFINYWLDFIWPQFCLGCKQEGSLCCSYCLNDILIEYDSDVNWPEQTKFCFASCHICCHYQNKLVQKILKTYKYSYLKNLSKLLVQILEKQARRLNLPANTIITNIPLHSTKLKERGFDQTEILAKGLAKQLNLTYIPLLKRQRRTKTQAQLTKKQRQQNMLNAFAATRQAGGGDYNILLIDDITTTGNTLNQAAQALQQANYKKITCLVLAKN